MVRPGRISSAVVWSSWPGRYAGNDSSSPTAKANLGAKIRRTPLGAGRARRLAQPRPQSRLANNLSAGRRHAESTPARRRHSHRATQITASRHTQTAARAHDRRPSRDTCADLGVASAKILHPLDHGEHYRGITSAAVGEHSYPRSRFIPAVPAAILAAAEALSRPTFQEQR